MEPSHPSHVCPVSSSAPPGTSSRAGFRARLNGMALSRSRLWTLAGALAPVVYVVAVALGGLLNPGYSQIAGPIGALTMAGASATTVLVPLFRPLQRAAHFLCVHRPRRFQRTRCPLLGCRRDPVGGDGDLRGADAGLPDGSAGGAVDRKRPPSRLVREPRGGGDGVRHPLRCDIAPPLSGLAALRPLFAGHVCAPLSLPGSGRAPMRPACRRRWD